MVIAVPPAAARAAADALCNPLVPSFSGIPAEEQRVMFGGKQLEDGLSLEACGISDDSQVCSMLRSSGWATCPAAAA